MTSKRRWICVAFGVGLACAAAWFEPTGVVRGWVRGEAFYHGRPTNYWSRELRQWEFNPWSGYYRNPGPLDWIADRITSWYGVTPNTKDRPVILSCDPAAQAVLGELLDDDDPDVREHAQRGLAQIEDVVSSQREVLLNPDYPRGVEMRMEFVLRWLLNDPDPIVRDRAAEVLRQGRLDR
jgi:hypothetical protein